MILGAALGGFGFEHRIGVAGDHDGGNPVLPADHELQAVEGSQPHVGDEQVWRVVAQQIARFLECTGRDDRTLRPQASPPVRAGSRDGRQQ